MEAEAEFKETAAAPAGDSKTATCEQLKELVAEAVLIEAITRRRAKASASKDGPAEGVADWATRGGAVSRRQWAAFRVRAYVIHLAQREKAHRR